MKVLHVGNSRTGLNPVLCRYSTIACLSEMGSSDHSCRERCCCEKRMPSIPRAGFWRHLIGWFGPHLKSTKVVILQSLKRKWWHLQSWRCSSASCLLQVRIGVWEPGSAKLRRSLCCRCYRSAIEVCGFEVNRFGIFMILHQALRSWTTVLTLGVYSLRNTLPLKIWNVPESVTLAENEHARQTQGTVLAATCASFTKLSNEPDHFRLVVCLVFYGLQSLSSSWILLGMIKQVNSKSN